MTKRVRIENADTSNFGVVVQVFEKTADENMPDLLIREVNLANPTDMTGNDVFLTSTRYLVVKEALPQIKKMLMTH